MHRLALLVAGLALLAGVAATLSGSATQAEARWVITDLGVIDWTAEIAVNERGQVVSGQSLWRGGRTIRVGFLWQNGRKTTLPLLPTGINESGQVVGEIGAKSGPYDTDAVLWQNGNVTNLGALGGKDSAAAAINDRGQVVGRADTPRNFWEDMQYWHAFLWQKGRMRDLGTLGGRESHAQAINERGQVVGRSDTARLADGFVRSLGFIWERGKMRDLGLRFRSTYPAVINDRGQVVGSVDGHAAVWESGQIRTLRPLGAGFTALDINEAGAVAGFCSFGPHHLAHPCLWHKDTVRDLGIAFGDRGKAVALNDRGQVVGFTRGGRGSATHAFVWEDGKMTDLGTLSGRSSEALAINRSGMIVGRRLMTSGETHAALWTLKRS